jgi:hypothetical protein
MVLACSGCVGTDAYRPTEILSISVDDEKAQSYSLILIDDDIKVPFDFENGVYYVQLPGRRYGTGLVFLIPVSNDPEKIETVLITKEGAEIARILVKTIRKMPTTVDGTYLISIEEK